VTLPNHVPTLRATFPRQVRAVHQIEITSRCNLKCAYCTHPTMSRPKIDMTRAHYERALEWVAHFVNGGTQHELNLAGIGESTMHGHFVEYVALAREVVGPSVKLVFATNGVVHDEAMIAALAPYKPEVWVSLHRPEKAAKAATLYKKYGMLHGMTIDPAVNANDWAGQVKWHNDTPGQIPCQWLREGKIFVLADGRISRCCLDASGIGIIGHVDDPIGSIKTSPYELCKACYQSITVDGWDQRLGTHTGAAASSRVTLPVIP
jgi:hypothetical protein